LSHFQEFDENDGQKITPLVIAARNGRYSVCSMLLKNFSPNIEKECTIKVDGHLVHGATALWCAAGSAPINVVKLLIKSGADVNHKTRTSSTPLRAACFDGRLHVIKYLVTHNADINLANMYNNTCLMIASYKGYSDVVSTNCFLFGLSRGSN
jgi:Fem-1 homolog b